MSEWEDLAEACYRRMWNARTPDRRETAYQLTFAALQKCGFSPVTAQEIIRLAVETEAREIVKFANDQKVS